VKNIDFLPEIYRERKALHHARIWWGIVVLIFGVAIGSTAAAQYLLRRSIQRQIDDLAPQFKQAQEQVRKLAQVQTENRTAGELAGLVTYLEQPWPRTQLVAEVIRPLPEAIQLTELQITEEEIARPATEEAGPRRRGRQTDDQQARLSPAQSDLATLRRNHDYKRAVIEISGTVLEEDVLHSYVAQVGRSTLVKEARLKTFEKVATANENQPTQFTVRLVFRPSHGQPNPEEAKPGAAPAVRVAQGGAGP
jgi:hypothetical protein